MLPPFPRRFLVLALMLGGSLGVAPAEENGPQLLQEARKIRRLAVEEARKVGDGMAKTTLFANVAVSQARAGDLQDAFETAHGLPDTERNAALRSIVWAQAEKGDVATALETAARIEDNRLKALALSEVAVAQARAGNFAGAVSTAKLIDVFPPPSALLAFDRIARLQFRAGDRASARQTLHEATAWIVLKTKESQPRDSYRSSAVSSLASIASTQSRMGDARGAAETREQIGKFLEEMQNPDARESALASMVRALAAAGDFVFARETAEQMKPGHHRDRALASIATEEARAGNLPAARETLETMEAPSEIAHARTSIGLIQSNQGDPLGAIQTAAAIPDAKARGEALAGLATVFLGQRRPEPAATALAQALQAAETAGKEGMGPEFWRDVAEAQARSGNVFTALQTARTIQDGNNRGWAMQFVARMESAEGDWHVALSWAEEETSPLVRAYALLGVADGLRVRVARTNAVK